MIVEVDPADPTPAYEQIHEQIARMIAAATLPPGTRLPPIRQLAVDLGLAKGTVARAYELLLADGLVDAAGRRGTVVAADANTRARDDRGGDELERAARAFAVAARQLGVGPTTALEAAARHLHSFEAPDAEAPRSPPEVPTSSPRR